MDDPMTPEEAKTHVERHLSELGWTARIGNAGYEKLSRFAAGNDVGINQLCHKLVSLGALQQRREITEDVLEMAMLDLTRTDGQAPAARARGNDGPEVDWSSIEQLAAVLEAKAAAGELEPEFRAPLRPARSNGTERAARDATAPAAVLPKILLADPSADARARFAKVLSKNFSIIEASDGEEAWRTLLDRTDIELVVTDLILPGIDGYDLIKRIREASSPPHLVGIPIMVVTAAEHADAKLRVLMTGANDFVIKNVDPLELRSRVLARHKLSKAAADGMPASPPPPRAPSPVSARGAAPAKQSARPAQAGEARGTGKARAGKAAPLAVLTAERRYESPKAGLRGVVPGAPPRKRVSSTMAITLSATVLLAIAFVAIPYLSREIGDSRLAHPPAATGPIPSSRPPAVAEERQTDTAGSSETGTVSAPPPSPPSTATAPKAAEPEISSLSTTTPAERSIKPPAENAAERSGPSPTPDSVESPSPRGGAERGTVTPAKPERAPPPESAPPPAIAQQRTTPAPEPRTPAATARPRPAVPVVPAAPPTASARNDAPEAEAASPRQEVAAARPPATTAPPAATAPPVTTVPSTAAAPEARAGPPVNQISREELASFVSRFASVYEAGDLEQFMSLFAENARTNDRSGRNAIRRDYESLFRTTDLRRMQLGEINWELDESQAHGWGEFDVTVRRQGDKEPYLYNGSLSFVVEKVDGRLRIVRLYHGQQRVGS